MTDERALEFLRELGRADEEAEATLAELDELAAGVERIRLRTLELEALKIRLPAERERLASEIRAAEEEVAGWQSALAAAEPDGVERAGDALRIAARRLTSARADAERLDSEAAAVERETVELESAASELAGALRVRPGIAEAAGNSPRPGLPGISQWATDARAALFVARGNLARQREALIRQANELGSAVLGEPLLAQSPAAVARRLEGEGG